MDQTSLINSCTLHIAGQYKLFSSNTALLLAATENALKDHTTPQDQVTALQEIREKLRTLPRSENRSFPGSSAANQ